MSVSYKTPLSIEVINNGVHTRVGTYFLLGSNIKAPHHNSQFDIDEESLNYGAKFMQKLLLTY